VPAHTSPVGPTAIASVQIPAIRPGSPSGSSSVANANVHPPSRLTRSPGYVVTKIVPLRPTAYRGSNPGPKPMLVSHTQ
jgi:hypothetical protein